MNRRCAAPVGWIIVAMIAVSGSFVGAAQPAATPTQADKPKVEIPADLVDKLNNLPPEQLEYVKSGKTCAISVHASCSMSSESARRRRFPAIPTFASAPVALTPEDLVAGTVDVAIVGAPLDMGSGYMHACMTGIAMRRKGITQEHFLSPLSTEHNQPEP